MRRLEVVGYPSSEFQSYLHYATGALSIMPSMQLARMLLGSAVTIDPFNIVAWSMALSSVGMLAHIRRFDYGARPISEMTIDAVAEARERNRAWLQFMLFASPEEVHASHFRTASNVGLIVMALTACYARGIEEAAIGIALALMIACISELEYAAALNYGAVDARVRIAPFNRNQ